MNHRHSRPESTLDCLDDTTELHISKKPNSAGGTGGIFGSSSMKLRGQRAPPSLSSRPRLTTKLRLPMWRAQSRLSSKDASLQFLRRAAPSANLLPALDSPPCQFTWMSAGRPNSGARQQTALLLCVQREARQSESPTLTSTEDSCCTDVNTDRWALIHVQLCDGADSLKRKYAQDCSLLDICNGLF